MYTIVGVMPARLSIKSWGATAQDLWVPLAYTDAERAVRDNHNDAVIARLKAGVSLAQAQSEMNVISARLEEQFPQTNAGWGATVVPLQELIVGDVRLSLLVLLAAVGLVLLIACANVGNLLFARVLARRKELAIRSALGAGRGRVFQQLLVEALILAAAGGAVGLALAHASLSAGATLLAGQVPRADELSIDGRVLLFVAAMSIVTAILAGAMPALRAGRTSLNDALKEGGRNDGAVGIRTRRALIVCEVALSLVLLMAAGVMLRTLSALRQRGCRLQSPRRADDARHAADDAVRDAGANQRLLRRRARTDPRTARASRRRARSTISRFKAGRCSRSSSKGMRSCCPAISRPSRSARSRQVICARSAYPCCAGTM